MAGLISARTLANLGALTHCPVQTRRPARPKEYEQAYWAAVGEAPLPFDPWGRTASPVAELDARKDLAVGMTAWQLGRFMRVLAVQPYEHDCHCDLLCSIQMPNGKEITFIGEDGSTSCRVVGGDEPVPVYCRLR